jgi:hypothetical protein
MWDAEKGFRRVRSVRGRQAPRQPVGAPFWAPLGRLHERRAALLGGPSPARARTAGANGHARHFAPIPNRSLGPALNSDGYGAYQQAQDPKELHWIEGATHVGRKRGPLLTDLPRAEARKRADVGEPPRRCAAPGGPPSGLSAFGDLPHRRADAPARSGSEILSDVLPNSQRIGRDRQRRVHHR